MTGWQLDGWGQELLYRRLLQPLATGQGGLLRKLRVGPHSKAVVACEAAVQAQSAMAKKVRFVEKPEPFLLTLYRETRMSAGGVAHSAAPLRAWKVAQVGEEEMQARRRCQLGAGETRSLG